MVEESYREFMCKLVNPGCDFAVRAKTDDEVIRLAHMHQEMAHGVKEISPDLEKEIREKIRPVSSDGHTF
jgi:predicted small metal-binding protein